MRPTAAADVALPKALDPANGALAGAVRARRQLFSMDTTLTGMLLRDARAHSISGVAWSDAVDGLGSRREAVVRQGRIPEEPPPWVKLQS
jgi:hypothetical protein